MEFPCTGCGECCRRIQTILEANHEHPVMREIVSRFPYKTQKDGSCEMLMEDGRCSVYDHRPLLCDVKKGGMVLGVNEEVWFRVNAEACNQMIREVGLGEEYLVSLDF